ncbi:hypothetical protein H6F86_06040 [Phormidium sp. FACHB-592]|uniref:Uncharacterized protein n=1 Tax=Stenomitos frigidus AS-A4 TaxID=2933935 RepID=A0ABV0KQ64_9CYAN|nr:hypothetical protein [Phormidium sp. FACHB-592]MBD2073452.1 hypothetical protein [Phormidium sp. FACHB-592]
MGNHFNLKSLTFYAVAITSVVTLFSVVTAYGEANLKAAQKIDGRYQIPAQDLPGCLKSDQLVLLVQQSGIYLTGSLLAADTIETLGKRATERPSMTGNWENQRLTLQGEASYLPKCQGTVKVQGTIAEQTLTGTLSLSSAPGDIPFTAQYEASQPKAAEH